MELLPRRLVGIPLQSWRQCRAVRLRVTSWSRAIPYRATECSLQLFPRRIFQDCRRILAHREYRSRSMALILEPRKRPNRELLFSMERLHSFRLGAAQASWRKFRVSRRRAWET